MLSCLPKLSEKINILMSTNLIYSWSKHISQNSLFELKLQNNYSILYLIIFSLKYPLAIPKNSRLFRNLRKTSIPILV